MKKTPGHYHKTITSIFFFQHTHFLTRLIKTNLVEAAMEEFFYFSSFKSDGLEVSFVVVIEECQGLSRVCQGTEDSKG